MSEPTTVPVPSLSDQAATVLQSLIKAATEAGDFIKGQVPLVIQELLAYNTAMYAVYAVVWLALAVGLVVVWRKTILVYGRGKAGSNYTNYDEPGFCIPTIIGLAALVLLVLSLVDTVANLLKITLAPRVWLIEYAASLAK